MSLSSPESALHHDVVGHITDEGLSGLPLRVRLKRALAITASLICLLSMQYLLEEKQDKSGKLQPL